ncbi:hypothetical protein [Marivita sp. GX14005]|uniref:hypothetical protein n=1 Tax=Marivita sp. GX14005 TaxID=2942276 RepID=UPI0020196AA9|nr:hypothetical protein [Marivita sp. GX14005]MCL3880774.1 hypothetical protein [Marivita sp. GX14005]
MKNLLLTSAITLGMTGAAFANDSQIDQIGLGNDATVTQSGGTGSGSVVLQTGDNDIATVVQSDTGGSDTNSSTIQQLGGSGTQTATVTQSYNGSGLENTALIVQDSTQGGNVAAVTQDGDDNFADARQGPGAAVNCFDPFGCSGTTPAAITNSDTNIVQSGTNNSATTTQIVGSNGGDNNRAAIDQNGLSNNASILQGTGAVANTWFIPNPASTDNDNLADILQDGDGNASIIAQGGESGVAFSSQFGNDNSSDIVQSGGIPGLGNATTVVQDGDRNTSTVTQSSTNGDLPVVPSGTVANVQQTGNDNESHVTQKPLGGHFASVMQMGDDHFSLIEQDGLLNIAKVTQELHDQSSEVHQTGPSIVGPLGNTAIVNQTITAGNTSYVSQQGIGNQSTVLQ